MRSADHGRENEWQSNIESVGACSDTSVATIMVNESDQIRCVVHGDDFTFIGLESGLTKSAARSGVLSDQSLVT